MKHCKIVWECTWPHFVKTYLSQMLIPYLNPLGMLDWRKCVSFTRSAIAKVPLSCRDLRPTNIRASTLSDEDTGSGDESDDDDVSDWSTDYEDPVEGKLSDDYASHVVIDLLADDLVQSTWPSADQYSPYCRHYESRLLSRPSSWSSSPFTLTRVRSNTLHIMTSSTEMCS